jgi:uncharacterized membrane protein YedE/YeeE
MSGVAGAVIRSLTFEQQQLFRFEGIKSVVYIIGLLFGGFLGRHWIVPQQFLNIKQWNIVQFLMFAIAGLLVGIGTQVGNGCTSGHMICGLARLSKRSFVAVISFCSVAFVMVKVFNVIDIVSNILGIYQDKLEGFMTVPTRYEMTILILIVLIVIIFYAVIISLDFPGKKGNIYLQLLLHFFNGLIFSLGLGISGMVNPVKVLGFFDVFGKHFDPSLVCVAIGAILLDLLLFQKFILVRKDPIIAKCFQLPKKTEIDVKLVLGAILFGLGWGTVGVCPGPAIVNLGALVPQFIVFNAMFAVGVFINDLYNPKL